MAPTERPEQDVTFFIAERLRGIPLVTSRYQTAKPEDVASSATQTSVKRLIESSVAYDTTPISTMSLNADTGSSDRNAQDAQPTPSASSPGANVAKRDLDSTSRLAREQGHKTKPEILFKASGVTASTANLIRPAKLTTTTPRPARTTTNAALNIRRAKQIYLTTTTPRPRARNNPSKPVPISRPARPQAASSTSRSGGGAPATAATATTTITMTAAAATTTTTTLGPTVLSKLQFGSTLSRLAEQPGRQVPLPAPMTTAPSVAPTTTPGSDVRLAKLIRNDPLWDSTNGLTRATLSSTTQPDHQRRNPQTLSSTTRFVNSPADGRSAFAGENWVLFNRGDGNFSFFEVMVLMSNIMIVSTVIMVILFNWVKSMRKRTSSTTTAKTLAQTATTQPIEPTAISMSPKDGSKLPSGHMDLMSERGSKMSMISSGLSGLTTASAIESIEKQQQKVPTDQTQGPVQVQKTISGQQKPANERGNDIVASDAVGAPLRIANEFRSSGGLNVANKAMAIVQPTENNCNNQSNPDKLVLAIKDELSAQSRAISRSVSDLSGGARQKPSVGVGAAEAKDASAKGSQTTDSLEQSESNRVAALEELFNGKAKVSAKGEPSGGGGGGGGGQESTTARRTSAGSLESVELPENLVESIEKSISRKPENVPMPSPNLLLGEAEPKGGAKVEVNAKKPPDDAGKSANPASSKEANSISINKKDTPQALKRSRTADNVVVSSNDPKVKAGADSGNDAAFGATSQRRPENPMGRMIEDKPAPVAQQQVHETIVEESPTATTTVAAPSQSVQAEVKNHQLVVNKLDKRKTDLEIVDIRDESVTGKMRGDKGATKQRSSDPSKSANPNDPSNVAAALVDDSAAGWISMEGVAVTKPSFVGPNSSATPGASSPIDGQSPGGAMVEPKMSPSEIIENRFHVDYASKRRAQRGTVAKSGLKDDSIDSKAEEYNFNNIENELEKDNKMKNRKYFVYVVHDGHFTAKKECIARIDLPSTKRRVTLAEMRQLISNSQDISLVSLRRNRFKFVTETYRLLNENEDAAVLHQVYPTQGVFLKLNIPEQENQAYLYKTNRGRASTPSGGGGGSGPGGVGGSSGSNAATPSSLSQATISSRRKNVASKSRIGEMGALPAIEVDYAVGSQTNSAYGYGRSRATSVGRQARQRGGPNAASGGAYRRSKSSVQTGARSGAAGRRLGGGTAAMRRSANNLANSGDHLPSIGRSVTNKATLPATTTAAKSAAPPTRYSRRVSTSSRGSRASSNGSGFNSSSSASYRARPSRLAAAPTSGASSKRSDVRREPSPNKSAAQTIGTAATDLGANMISGAKKLFSTTFGL